MRFIHGLIAGIVLPELIPVQGDQALSRPLLALLGGFSASVVYRLLSRLVDTLESLFQGDPREFLAERSRRPTRRRPGHGSRNNSAWQPR